MAKTTNKGSGLPSMVLGLALLSLVFLGSPGCGCGDDDLPPADERPERCCCTFEWQVPRTANGADVDIVLQNADVSLDATVTPSTLTNVMLLTTETFTVCVNEEHLIGDSLELRFVDADDATLYGHAALFYDTRCEPIIEPLLDITQLRSTDCGDDPPLQCCCEFEWLPGANQVGDVTINAENVSPGLNPVITPSALTGVGPDSVEIFDVCVDDDHPIDTHLDLVFRQQGSGAVVGTVQLVYDELCTPTIVPVTSAPTLNLTSTDCGGDPLTCCCNFRWLPPVDYTGNVTLTAQSPSPGLDVTITPSTINGVVPRTFYDFQICINGDHNLLDQFTLVIADAGGGGDVLQSTIVYRLRCEPDIGVIAGAPQGLTTTDCGGSQLTCCCEFEWILTDPDFNPPPSPWTVTLENVDPTLEVATVTPTTIEFVDTAPTTVLFEICVNAGHTLGAAMELVITAPDPTGGSTPIELARLPMDWTPTCLPVTGDPSGFGTWINLCAGPD